MDIGSYVLDALSIRFAVPLRFIIIYLVRIIINILYQIIISQYERTWSKLHPQYTKSDSDAKHGVRS